MQHRSNFHLFHRIPDDSLNQLQSIRESLMQMKSPTNQNFSALNTMVSEFHGISPFPRAHFNISPILSDEQLQIVLVVSLAS